MEFFKQKTSIDFMKQRRFAAIFSVFIFAASLAALMVNGLQLGLDFTGGTQVIASMPKDVSVQNIRSALAHDGYLEVLVQPYGGSADVMIKISDKEQSTLRSQLHTHFPAMRIQSVDYIGPQVGKTLMTNGVLAIIVSLLATMLYIALRFDYRFSVSAAVALIHDPVLILGVFALFKIQFDLIALAALLTIIGYSLNDTVVVYDRVREHFMKIRHMTTTEIMNLSINGTLSRTIMTSGLTLLVVLALLFLGGETLFGFSLALVVGILIGTYSSIYIAGSLAVVMGLQREHLLPTPKAANQDQV